ncbi:hypothetical protein GCM10017784_30370 [Deinococcus indicus]|uniref:hypothetical protein n=1 Tax=Deinococcus indicus TaxID=223556 RepID=UPI00174D36F0|nr:hypothetical protein [Deinococcus indicus]GHG34484.1 hypothetical protein GCM10017784_30370 [Deinococcus indicus]
MKKKLALLPLAVLILASCDRTPATDPRTLTFTGVGVVTNFAPSKDYSLTIPGDTSKSVVGTLKADKSVSVSITADAVSKLSFSSSQTFYNNLKASNCDVSKLQIVNVEYVNLSAFDFSTSSGNSSYAEMSTETPNSDGTITTKRTNFYYSKGEGSIKGLVSCENTVVGNYNMVLKPGWNEVSRTNTYNPTTKTSSATTFDVISQKNSYSGQWRAFSRQ